MFTYLLLCCRLHSGDFTLPEVRKHCQIIFAFFFFSFFLFLFLLLEIVSYFLTFQVSGAPGKDLVVEQMMPKKTIGRRYILGSNLAPATEETVKVVTIKDNVRFSFGGDCYTSTEERQVFTFHRPSNQIVEIIADDQILVAQFIQASGSATPDAVMNLAVPYRQWSTSYEVYVPARDPADPREFVHLSFLKHRDTILQFTGMQVFTCWCRGK